MLRYGSLITIILKSLISTTINIENPSRYQTQVLTYKFYLFIYLLRTWRPIGLLVVSYQ